MVLHMRRVFDDQAQQWRASMILWSCRDVWKHCAPRKLRRQGSVAITAVRVPPMCRERKAKHCLALQQKRRRIMAVRWRGFGALVRCQSRPPSCSPYPDQTPLPRHRARSRCTGQATAAKNLITFGPKFCSKLLLLKIKLLLLLHVLTHCFIAPTQNLFISSSLSNMTLTLSTFCHHCTVQLSIAIIIILEYILKFTHVQCEVNDVVDILCVAKNNTLQYM